MLNNPLDPNRPVLPEWTRWAWASVAEREYWLESIQTAGRAWNEIERLAVVEGVRSACRVTVPDSELVATTKWATSRGLVATVVCATGPVNAYSSVQSGKASTGAIVLVISKPEVLPQVLAYVNSTENGAGGDDALGQLLGFPKCCREFFGNTWGKKQVDSTWDQYAATGNANGPVECNMLWRWMNIRWVPHLPCSFQCEETAKLGKQFREVALKYGYLDEANTIDKVLSWSTSWSGVNGLAEIEGPCLKVCTRTDWAPPTDNRFFKRLGRPYIKPTAEGWTLNGFTSYARMKQSHDIILPVAKEFVPTDANIIDLGCGTGALMRTLMRHIPGVSISGMDYVEAAVDYAKKNGPGKWIAGNFGELDTLKILVSDTRPNVVFYSPNRLLELTDEKRLALVEFLNTIPLHIAYSYSDTNAKKPLPEWVAEAGFDPSKLLMVAFTNSLTSVGVLKPLGE